MGKFTERCIENLLGELQVYAERANEAMSLIVDNFQLTYDEQEDTVDLTRIEHPDWYGSDFEKECKVGLESYEGIINNDIDNLFENYFDLVESYFSEFEEKKRCTLLRKLMSSSSFFIWHQSLVIYDYICDFKEQDCELMETFEGSYANSVLCIIDDFYSFIRKVVDLCKIYEIDAYEIDLQSVQAGFRFCPSVRKRPERLSHEEVIPYDRAGISESREPVYQEYGLG